jgi:hypothetical protein
MNVERQQILMKALGLDPSNATDRIPPGEVPPYAGYLEVHSHMLWDRLIIGGEIAQVYNLFCNPIGALDPLNFSRPKTILFTNMQRGNHLPPPCAMAIDRLLVMFSPSSRDIDVDQFRERYVLELRRADKIVYRGPMLRFPLRATREDAEKLNEPWCVCLDEPVLIAPMQQFSLALYRVGDESLYLRTDIDLTIGLDGMGTFGVQ